jgi:hypothetical protein
VLLVVVFRGTLSGCHPNLLLGVSLWSGCHPNLLRWKSGSFQNGTPMNKFIGCTCSNLINQVRAYSQPASAGLGFCEASVLTDAAIRLVICRGWAIENSEFLGKTEFIPCLSVPFRVIPCYSVAVFRATWSGWHPNLLMWRSGSFQNATPMNKFIGCTYSNLMNQVRAHSQPASAGLGFCEASVLTDADIRLVICRGWRIENSEFLGKTEFIPCLSVPFRVIPCYSVAVFRATWSGWHPNLLMWRSGSFQNATPMNEFIGCTAPAQTWWIRFVLIHNLLQQVWVLVRRRF